jgi:hypothetical protein
MRICQTHWDQMRAKLTELGIGHLGAKSGEQALANTEAQIERGPGFEVPNNEWDPLMSMNWNFFSRALDVIGLAAMAPDFGCPLCHARASFDQHNTPTGRCEEPECTIYIAPGSKPYDTDWIDGCGEVMRAEALRRGLVKPS